MTLFDGWTFDEDRDGDRLRAQYRRVWGVMADRGWHTLAEMSERTGDPPASISARIRDFRKPKFGGHTVERLYVSKGLWTYRLIPSKVLA
jgi:hypothetical protein